MRINLMPMAGEGQRFKDAGYQIPKPLIEINRVPMFVRAARSLPQADRHVFACRQEHLDHSDTAATAERYFPGAFIVPVAKLTEGQAMTCMLAAEHIPPDAALTIGASDCDMTYDARRSEAFFADPLIDGWIWTFRNNPAVLQNPKMYGWVEIGADGAAVRVSCKVPLSDQPLQDHAVIGAFTFKRAEYFFKAVEDMRRADDRVNREFYVDVAMNYAIRAGLRIQVLEVERYICWGTPQDYLLYEYWRGYFQRRGAE